MHHKDNMNNIKIKVSAKLNLTLDVVCKRSDGFHELDSVMCSVNVYDRISVAASDSINIIMNGKSSNNNNIAYKTVALAMERCGVTGANVIINKGIPFSAGMGGSSADASGVLFCLGKLFGIDGATIDSMARELGSDTNFMLNGGICRCKGKGDAITNLEYKKIYFAIIKPQYGVNTAKVFANYDNLNKIDNNELYTDRFIAKYCCNNVECYKFIHNDLIASAILINGGIEKAMQDMAKYTPYVSMTGSGSAVFGVFDSENDARYAANKLESKYYFSRYAISTDCGILEL